MICLERRPKAQRPRAAAGGLCGAAVTAYLPVRHLGQDLDGIRRVADGSDDDPPLVGGGGIQRASCRAAEAHQHACQQKAPSPQLHHGCLAKAACRACVPDLMRSIQVLHSFAPESALAKALGTGACSHLSRSGEPQRPPGQHDLGTQHAAPSWNVRWYEIATQAELLLSRVALTRSATYLRLVNSFLTSFSKPPAADRWVAQVV